MLPSWTVQPSLVSSVPVMWNISPFCIEHMYDSLIVHFQALRSTQQACNPIYVSVGHKIGLETAVSLTHACCQYRIPEPIRQVRKKQMIKNNYYSHTGPTVDSLWVFPLNSKSQYVLYSQWLKQRFITLVYTKGSLSVLSIFLLHQAIFPAPNVSQFCCLKTCLVQHTLKWTYLAMFSLQQALHKVESTFCMDCGNAAAIVSCIALGRVLHTV